MTNMPDGSAQEFDQYLRGYEHAPRCEDGYYYRCPEGRELFRDPAPVNFCREHAVMGTRIQDCICEEIYE